MVFKILGDFDNCEFNSVLSRITKYFDFLYIDGVLFVALQEYRNRDAASEIMEECFKDFVVISINEKNLMKLGHESCEWCRDELLKLDRQRFEENEQARLRETWKAMDRMEEELERKLGGE